MIVPCTAAVSLKIVLLGYKGGSSEPPRTPPGYGPDHGSALGCITVHLDRASALGWVRVLGWMRLHLQHERCRVYGKES